MIRIPSLKNPSKLPLRRPLRRPFKLDSACVLCLMPIEGNKWVDWSGNGNHGTIDGAVWSANGPQGKNLKFNRRSTTFGDACYCFLGYSP